MSKPAASPVTTAPASPQVRLKWLKPAVAGAAALVLMVAGLHGREQARRQARVEDVARVRDQLLRTMEDAAWPAASGAPEAARRDDLKGWLALFDSDYGRDRLPPVQSLEIRLSRAALANAEGRHADALELVTSEDEPAASPGLRARVWQARGDAFYGLREWRAALEHYGRWAGLQSNRIAAAVRAADCRHALGQVDEALAAYDALARQQRGRGGTLLAEGRADAAAAHFGRAIALHARLVEQEGRTGLADALAASHAGLGDAQLLQGKAAAAARNHERAAALLTGPVDREGRADLAAALAFSHDGAGNAFLLEGRPDAAAAHFEKAASILNRLVDQQARPDLVQDLALSLGNLGNALLGLSKLDPAIAHYDQAVGHLNRLVDLEGRGELAHELAVLRNNRGVARRVADKPDLAVEDFDHAIKLLNPRVEPMPPGTRGGTAGVRVRLETVIIQADRGLEALTRVRAAGPAPRDDSVAVLAAAFKNRGQAQLGFGRLNLALADLRRAVELFTALVGAEGQDDLRPQLAGSLDAAAWIHATSADGAFRDGAKAREYAQRACELGGWKDFAPIQTLAAAWAESGNYREAVRWQEKALELAPPGALPEGRSLLQLYRSGRPYRAPAPRAE